MSVPQWVSSDLPVDKPSAARMYDYLLGGYHNFAIDRAAAERLIAINPEARLVMQTHRAFQRRAVKFFVEQRIDQFLDLGSIMPTVGSSHETAQQLSSTARVVYADIDPDTVLHSQAVLRDNPSTLAIQADPAAPEQFLNDPRVRSLLDFGKPIGVLVALLHFLPDDAEAYAMVRAIYDAVPAGSCLAISQGSNEGSPREVVEPLEALYARSTTPVKLRSRAEIAAFFGGLEVVEPGLVWVPLWRPEGPDDLFLDEPSKSATFGGVGCRAHA